MVYLKQIYSNAHFLDPTDIDSTEEAVRVPLTLAALPGLLAQRAKHIAQVKASMGTPQQKAPEFPDELNTAKARKLIDKAVEAGFITVKEGRHTWNSTKVLLAYFAVKATAYLNLSTIADATVSWKPFETLFQVKNLKQAKADYGKFDEDFKPRGSDRIDPLFEG